MGSIGVILLMWLVMVYVGSWRVLLVCAAVPSFIVILSLKWYPESARYYLVSGQQENAERILRKLAETNRAELPPGRLIHVGEKAKRGRIGDLLSPDYRRTSLLFWYIWLATAVGYYGIALLSPLIIQKGSLSVEGANGTFGYNMRDPVPCSRFTRQNYIDLLWTSAAEFPGLIVFTFLVERMRRKTLLCCACIISSILSVLLLLKAHKILNLLILFAARATLVSIFQLNYIMTSEPWELALLLSIGRPHSSLYSTSVGAGKPCSCHVSARRSTADCRSDGHFLALRNQRSRHERISHLPKVTACKSDSTERFWRKIEADATTNLKLVTSHIIQVLFLRLNFRSGKRGRLVL
ncbi:synaptic vesicle 2-related protein [Caerostris extrusa]|uniref:Synaptic vesicle 2-related protein n=1 Tax=Caerostris extrusa TaxID=172846 RepID=A0AAV4S8L7_CAEEX|nr:synaptic vesicle 2-related protein [Caerostris extrusa]